uniref:Huntingtin n=1 Tax=Oryzias melastigma TaxID=30732 RepID=A0A3B3CSM4_ORYME
MATMEKLMKAFESLKSFQQQQGPPTVCRAGPPHPAAEMQVPQLPGGFLSLTL